MALWRVYLCEHAGDRRTPVDMKGVVLDSYEKAQEWMRPDPIRPKYLRTHPELDGQKIELEEDTH